MTHTIYLPEDRYRLLIENKKQVEVGLFDEKYQTINANDQIIFINENSKEELAVNVKGLFRARSFKELFKFISPEACGFKSKEEALKILEDKYEKIDLETRTVVGIIVAKQV